MDSAWLVLLALALGLVVGGGFVLLVTAASNQGSRAAAVVRPGVPDGAAQVVDALEISAVVLDPSNNIVKVTQAALATGLVLGGHLAQPELVNLVDRVRRSGRTETVDLQMARGPFGEAQLDLHVRAAALGTRYVILLAEDRTEARRLDDVRRDFIANVSHELKTPIGAIGVLSDALQEAADEPDQVRRFAKRLTAEAHRLSRITSEIIELSRLQAADALETPQLVEIDHLVSVAVDQNRVSAEARRISLVTGGQRGLAVYGDETLLVMALHNLIANAVAYSSDGSRVGIGVSEHDGIVEIAVADQGIGIAEEDQERIFERFFRVDPARSRNTGGTGLGLSIVKHAVQNHGGDVRLWSRPGRGSTFTIRLPEASHETVRSLGENRDPHPARRG